MSKTSTNKARARRTDPKPSSAYRIWSEFSGEVRKSEAVALSDPVMPVFDSLIG